jgi:hypothetical protein
MGGENSGGFCGERLMQAEVAVALGGDDDALELPWASEDGSLRFYDLRENPELIFNIQEAADDSLLDFLVAVNGEHSSLQSVKCDTWLSDQMDVEDEYFATTWKHGSYVDVVFIDRAQAADQYSNLEFAEALVDLLKHAPEIPASAEVVLRRCYFHHPEREGYALTLYSLGYGDDPDQARQRWAIAMRLMQAAIHQLSATRGVA